MHPKESKNLTKNSPIHIMKKFQEVIKLGSSPNESKLGTLFLQRFILFSNGFRSKDLEFPSDPATFFPDLPYPGGRASLLAKMRRFSILC
jgi:hypothetical protein